MTRLSRWAIAFVLFSGFTVSTPVVSAGEPSAKETTTPDASLTAKQCEQLVSQLANPGKAPFDHSDPFLDYDVEKKIRASQRGVETAYRKLGENIEVALPILMKHIHDPQYSYAYEIPSNGALETNSVGGACAELIEHHVEIYHSVVRKMDVTQVPRSLYFIQDGCGGINQWWKGREHKTLAELQLEAVEWAAKQSPPKSYESNEEWAAAVKELKDLAHQLRQSKQPVAVRERSFFGK